MNGKLGELSVSDRQFCNKEVVFSMTSTTRDKYMKKRNTIRVVAPTGDADKLLRHFRDVVYNVPGLRFDTASIHQKHGGRGGVGRNKYYPLVLRDEHIDVIFLYGKNEPIPTPILVSILKLAGFDRPDVFAALEKNPLIDVYIWSDRIKQY